MSARNYAQTIGAGGFAIFPAGRFFFVKTASAALDITTYGNTGAPVTFTGIGAGSKFGPVGDGQGWTTLRVDSATAQNVEIIISDDGLFDVANTVTVSGSVATIPAPNTGINDTAAVTLPNAATTAIVAANPSRKSVTITNPSTATGSFFIRTAAGANNLAEVQPGTSITLNNTAAISGRNDSGGALSALVLEET